MATTTTIGGSEIRLSLPDSLMLRYEVSHLLVSNFQRGICAALGICWRGTGRPKVSFAQCQHNMAVYGGHVFDELMSRGIEYEEILSAGGEAIKLIHGGLVSSSEVEEVENFTEAEPVRATG